MTGAGEDPRDGEPGQGGGDEADALRFSWDVDQVDWAALVALFERAKLGRRREPGRLETAFRNSALRLFVYDGPALVGVGRALSDGVSRAALYDVAVLPEYQGRGIGQAIVRRLLAAADVELTMLYAAPGKEAFYAQFGFRRMRTAMAIMPDEADARARGLIE